ncbi:MAG: prolipoprotein diacylglyceryl transferase [Clostridiales bacterium]|jgi:phosphatidylglycerol:prolipoprotein diacylglycerol transferase|nr:prolipoprotein diacylglyceryl transferase [Clostridiales bacterium]
MPEVWFPNLNIQIEKLPRVAFTVFGQEIYWYAILIMTGFIVALLLALKEAKRAGHNPETYIDFFMVVVIFGIIGARAYFVIFSWDSYKDNLLSIFYLREGGLAIYGGLIAVFFAGIVFARVKKINFASFADVVLPGVAVAQAIGRVGNFVNREVFGNYTESLLAMRYIADQVDVIPPVVAQHLVTVSDTVYIQVAPTFLYESLGNLGLFCVLVLVRRRKKFDGQIGLMYFAGYGIGRFFIEGVRTDQLFLFNTGIPVSQVVSVIIVLICISLGAFLYAKSKKQNAENENDESEADETEAGENDAFKPKTEAGENEAFKPKSEAFKTRDGEAEADETEVNKDDMAKGD